MNTSADPGQPLPNPEKPSATPPKSLAELTAGMKPPRAVAANEVRVAARAANSPFFVVLDDDPTGTQSVADLPVLTAWDEADFRWAIGTGAGAVYVMTNSRSLAPDAARAVNQEVVAAAWKAGEQLGREVAFVSRSDSTLRGHFPLEPDTIADEIEARGGTVDGVVIIPAFGDAGRITVGGVHYAGSERAGFIPVGESEFAADATFGYQNSALAKWVEEKSAGAYPADSVIAISLDELRGQSIGDGSDDDIVSKKLASAADRRPIICDIVTEDDLRLLSLALINAEAAGKRFIYRVGPPFMRARLGQEVPEPLSVDQIAKVRDAGPGEAGGGLPGSSVRVAGRGVAPSSPLGAGVPTGLPSSPARTAVPGGLVVVGSHVGVTTRQLARLEQRTALTRIEINVAKVIDEAAAPAHIQGVIDEAVHKLAAGSVVISTSRKLVRGKDEDDSLRIARLVSAAVVQAVQGVIARVAPRFVVAKGGITSSDVASKGLAMRHAWVVGPMLPGIVSLWAAQDGPGVGIPYIIFAGNVGDDESLAQVVDKLSA